MIHIVTFILVSLFFFEIYHFINYVLKIKKRYPLKELIHLLIIFLIGSLVFIDLNLSNLILSFVGFLYVLSLVFKIKLNNTYIDLIFIIFFTTFAVFNVNLFFLSSSFILIWMFYKKDIEFLRNNLKLSKDHHYSLLSKEELLLLIKKDIDFIYYPKLLELLEDRERKIIELILEFMKFPQVVFLNKNKTRLLKKMKINFINDKIKKMENNKFSYSVDKKDYIILDDDYERSNKIDKYFNKKYKFRMLEIFNNKCAKTNSIEDIEIDHFLIPKSKGGNFILFHKKGYLLLNAIPLHKAVNLEKSNILGSDFFDESEVESILNKLEKINILLNKDKNIWKLFNERIN